MHTPLPQALTSRDLASLVAATTALSEALGSLQASLGQLGEEVDLTGGREGAEAARQARLQLELQQKQQQEGGGGGGGADGGNGEARGAGAGGKEGDDGLLGVTGMAEAMGLGEGERGAEGRKLPEGGRARAGPGGGGGGGIVPVAMQFDRPMAEAWLAAGMAPMMDLLLAGGLRSRVWVKVTVRGLRGSWSCEVVRGWRRAWRRWRICCWQVG